MIAMWMLRLLAATALIALAARLADEATRGLDRPRRWVWVGAFVVVALLPWLGGLLPAPSLAGVLLDRLMPTVVAEAPAVDADAMTLAIAAGADPQRALVDVALIGGWALASLVLVFLFVRALWRMRVPRRRGQTGCVKGIEVIRSDSLGPATVGIVRPTIVLPRWVDELSESERGLIVSHEREHAMARDPLLLAAAALVVVAAPWCLPLWWMHRRLRDAAEMDCDARVLAHGADRLTYGRALLRAAGRPRGPVVRFAVPLLGGLDVTRLERRILMMTRQRAKHPVLRAVPLIVVAAVVAVVGCDAVRDPAGAPDRASDTIGSANLSNVEVREGGLRIPQDPLTLGSGISFRSGFDLRGNTIRFSEIEPSLVLRNAHIEADTSGARSVSGEPMPGAEREAVERAVAVAEHLQEERQRHGVRTSDGSAGSDAVFYIDGERVGDGGVVVKDLDPATIERIEVIKGKLVALYPPDHAAGVVHIYTKKR